MRSVAASIFLLLFATCALGQESTTILGPKNVELQDGADALRAGDAEEGIRLTRIGLSQAANSRERSAAYSNLCAGYVLLGEYERGLPFCNDALEENDRHWRARCNRALIYIKLRRFAEANEDLLVGEEINPKAKSLQAVRRMYLDATNPVAPTVIVDDRRDVILDGSDEVAGSEENE